MFTRKGHLNRHGFHFLQYLNLSKRKYLKENLYLKENKLCRAF